MIDDYVTDKKPNGNLPSVIWRSASTIDLSQFSIRHRRQCAFGSPSLYKNESFRLIQNDGNSVRLVFNQADKVEGDGDVCVTFCDNSDESKKAANFQLYLSCNVEIKDVSNNPLRLAGTYATNWSILLQLD